MRTPWSLLLAAALVALAAPALAATNPYDVSWAALDPGTDWAAQVLRSVFPIPGGAAGVATGVANEATVIQQIVAQLTGFIGAIACAFVTYTVVTNIHRAAETSRVLGQGMTWMFVVRVGFAGIMMFPIGGGFSAGQALVMQGAMAGIGMARAVYANAIQAIGPDAMVVAIPSIPGSEQAVLGLINSELCMDLINQASLTAGTSAPLVPIPAAISDVPGNSGAYTTYRYDLSVGNVTGDPVCGTVNIAQTLPGANTVAGVSVDMAAVQNAILNNVLTGSIRSQVASVASNLWTTKQASALAPLQGILTSATNSYTAALTSAATNVESALRSAMQTNAQAARNGTSDLLTSEVQQNTLGWTSAGAYYLEIAKLNSTTLSLLNTTPTTTAPSYDGIGPALAADMAPLETAVQTYMTTLQTVVQTQDSTFTPSGVPQTLANANSNASGANLLTQIFGQLHLSNGILQSITAFIIPASSEWYDPFGSLMAMGQTLINTSLAAMGAAALLASATTSTGAAVWNILTLNWGGAAATIAGHAVMSFMGAPIFAGLLLLLLPGLVIAYVLPMIPYVMWMAGVLGWIILVCEAMVAVPLWMLAHMTLGGDGLHGRAVEGWALLFNVVFRPVLMVIGLFLSYFCFSCMSWLIRESFGIAAGFVLSNGWVVSNFLGIGVLLSIFVMTHVTAAIMSFRMIALLPHHLPRLIGFSSANRVDMDSFQNQAAWAIGGLAANRTAKALSDGAGEFGGRVGGLLDNPQGRISGPSGGSDDAGMDSTLRATTGETGTGEVDE